jgi:hypothetical protein
MMPAPEEATADSRQMARVCRDTYVALVAEGFTEMQALIIIGQCISAAAKQNREDDS